MKKILEIKIFILILFVLSFSAFGQTPEEIEKELVQHLKNISDWTLINDRTGEDVSEKLTREHEIFKAKLLKNTKRNSTLNFKFNDLAKHMHIATSADGKLRVYSWDTLTGGTMHLFDDVFQFVGKDGKVYSKSYDLDEGAPKSFVYDIFTLETKKGTVYLTCSTFILSTPLSYQSIGIFKIGGKSLNETKLFKTRSGITSSIGFQYDFFSVYKRKERPIKLFHYDKSTKTIKFPVVIENEKNPYGRVTKKLIVYKFNGRHFVKVGYQS